MLLHRHALASTQECSRPSLCSSSRIGTWLLLADVAAPAATYALTHHVWCLAHAGWILFLVFAGWGMFACPIDWIFQYIRRPKAVITKSEFIERARGLAQRAKEIKVGGGRMLWVLCACICV
jgi:hypothetical protein